MMYKFVVGFLRLLVSIIWGVQVEGAENIPHNAGAIVAGNHTTWFDPVAIAVAIKRPVHFMAKAELFKNPFLNWLFTKVNAFPVKRGLGDRHAIRTAQERVMTGNLVGMFPEGTRNKTGDELLPLQGGATLISIKTGVPVIPVVVYEFKLSRIRRPIKVTIGKPVNLGGPKKANKSDVAHGNELIYSQFRSLLSRNN